MDSKEPAQSSKRLDEGKVAAAVGVTASGIYFFRRYSVQESSVTTEKPINPLLAAIAPKPKPENATGVSSSCHGALTQAPACAHEDTSTGNR